MLDQDTMFDSNMGSAERGLAKRRLKEFVMEFLAHPQELNGKNSTLGVFCRVDVGIFANKNRRVSIFVNEVERGITTCLWVIDGTGSEAGLVGTDMAYPLAKWITEEQLRIGRSGEIESL